MGDEREVIYTEKSRDRFPAPHGQLCMLQRPKDHKLINKGDGFGRESLHHEKQAD
jgi:hypothetical protein